MNDQQRFRLWVVRAILATLGVVLGLALVVDALN